MRDALARSLPARALVALAASAVLLVGGCGDDDDETVIIPPTPGQTAPDPARADTDGGPADDDPDTDEATTGGADDDSGLQRSEPAAGPAPAGFNTSSLLQPDNLRRALAAARGMGQGGKPVSLRAEPARVDLQLRRADGALVVMQVAVGTGPRVISVVPGAAAQREAMAWSAIDPQAPERMATSTKSTAESGPTSTSYVVLMGDGDRWVLYRASGKGFTANANGRGGTSIPGT